MPEWLELELAHQLSPAAAPDALWERIQNGRPVARHAVPRWPIAAILTLLVAAATLWLAAKGQEPELSLGELALQQLNHPAPLDLLSSDPAAIAAWARRHAGIPLSIPAATRAHLSGVRLIQKRGTLIAAVDYTVGNDAATLLVARTGPDAGTPHRRLSWRSGGLTYALACSDPDHPEAACLLCHASL
jgi:hypothetical protein